MRDDHDREIAVMFDRIAARYDVLNRVLSFGTDVGWRRRAIARAGIRPGMLVADVGAGTGDLSFAAAARGARVLAIDLSPGILVVLGLSHPSSASFARLYSAYFDHVVPAMAALLGGDRDAYRYLPRSLRPFPEPGGLATMLRDAGFGSVGFERLSLGIAAIHVAQV